LLDLAAISGPDLGDLARRSGAVGDLLGEIVAAPKFFPHDLHDVLGMTVVLGKDQCLGDFGAIGEYLRE